MGALSIVGLIWRLATSKAGMVIIAGGIVVVGVLYYGSTRYQAGWDDALATVAQMNDEAAEAAGEAARTVTDCIDQGGTWDVTNGSCDR
ncbi:MAG: hypothetical protein AB7O39_03090 [Flavobacteriaceae bacterium]